MTGVQTCALPISLIGGLGGRRVPRSPQRGDHPYGGGDGEQDVGADSERAHGGEIVGTSPLGLERSAAKLDARSVGTLVTRVPNLP